MEDFSDSNDTEKEIVINLMKEENKHNNNTSSDFEDQDHQNYDDKRNDTMNLLPNFLKEEIQRDEDTIDLSKITLVNPKKDYKKKNLISKISEEECMMNSNKNYFSSKNSLPSPQPNNLSYHGFNPNQNPMNPMMGSPMLNQPNNIYYQQTQYNHYNHVNTYGPQMSNYNNNSRFYNPNAMNPPINHSPQYNMNCNFNQQFYSPVIKSEGQSPMMSQVNPHSQYNYNMSYQNMQMHPGQYGQYPSYNHFSPNPTPNHNFYPMHMNAQQQQLQHGMSLPNNPNVQNTNYYMNMDKRFQKVNLNPKNKMNTPLLNEFKNFNKDDDDSFDADEDEEDEDNDDNFVVTVTPPVDVVKTITSPNTKEKKLTSTMKPLSKGSLNQLNPNNNASKFPKQNTISGSSRSDSRSIGSKKNKNKKRNMEEKPKEEKTFNNFLKNIGNNLVPYICSQKGSRHMQQKINKITPEELDKLIDVIGEKFSDLMIDLYGNYFCQKLFQTSSSQKRICILNYIKEKFIDISCHSSGTHSMQSLLEILNLKTEEEIIKDSVKDHVIYLAYHNHGTHVLQKIISCFDEKNREYINVKILEDFQNMVLNTNGICVIKKLINFNKDDSIKDIVKKEIMKNCLEIVQNPYGNYLIQFIVSDWGLKKFPEIKPVLLENVISLSMQKFSSNVIEKCLEHCTIDEKKEFIELLFNVEKLPSMLKNKYGELILKKAVEIMPYDMRVEKKEILIKKGALTSSKDKSRLNKLINIL